MKKLFVIGFLCIVISLSLQAKEKTLEERLAEAKKNSAIAEKKAAEFQKNFGKEDSYPQTSEKLAIATCKAIKSMDWDKLYSYTVDDLHEGLTQNIKKIKKEKLKYQEHFSYITCKIKSSKEIGSLHMKYHFDGLGNIETEFLDGWKVTRL